MDHVVGAMVAVADAGAGGGEQLQQVGWSLDRAASALSAATTVLMASWWSSWESRLRREVPAMTGALPLLLRRFRALQRARAILTAARSRRAR